MCSETTNQVQLDHDHTNSQPWWRSNGPDSIELADSVSKSFSDGSMEARNGKDRVREDLNSTDAQNSGLDGNYGPEHQNLQHVASTAPPTTGGYLIPQTEPELVGHSIACAPYPYSDPYYAGLMTAYGAQALVNPQLLGMHQFRMPLPLEMAEEPVYVNPKQYNGIMRRRQSRAKAELEKKLIKNRKPYLHESRHQHAMRRQRGCGGRFLNTKKKATAEKGNESAALPSTQSASLSDAAMTNQSINQPDASNGHEQFKEGLMKPGMNDGRTYSNEDGNGNSCYQRHQNFMLSTFHPPPGERRDEGDCSCQQRGSVLVRQSSHRALTTR